MKKRKRPASKRKPKAAPPPKRLTIDEKLDLLLVHAKEETEHRERIYLEILRILLRAM